MFGSVLFHVEAEDEPIRWSDSDSASEHGDASPDVQLPDSPQSSPLHKTRAETIQEQAHPVLTKQQRPKARNQWKNAADGNTDKSQTGRKRAKLSTSSRCTKSATKVWVAFAKDKFESEVIEKSASENEISAAESSDSEAEAVHTMKAGEGLEKRISPHLEIEVNYF
jgi:hypothetical protein